MGLFSKLVSKARGAAKSVARKLWGAVRAGVEWVGRKLGIGDAMQHTCDAFEAGVEATVAAAEDLLGPVIRALLDRAEDQLRRWVTDRLGVQAAVLNALIEQLAAHLGESTAQRAPRNNLTVGLEA